MRYTSSIRLIKGEKKIMDLFVLFGVVTGWRRPDVLGVYSTREAAVEAAASFEETEGHGRWYDSFQVCVHYLDEPAELGQNRVEDFVL